MRCHSYIQKVLDIHQQLTMNLQTTLDRHLKIYNAHCSPSGAADLIYFGFIPKLAISLSGRQWHWWIIPNKKHGMWWNYLSAADSANHVKREKGQTTNCSLIFSVSTLSIIFFCMTIMLVYLYRRESTVFCKHGISLSLQTYRFTDEPLISMQSLND